MPWVAWATCDVLVARLHGEVSAEPKGFGGGGSRRGMPSVGCIAALWQCKWQLGRGSSHVASSSSSWCEVGVGFKCMCVCLIA